MNDVNLNLSDDALGMTHIHKNKVLSHFCMVFFKSRYGEHWVIHFCKRHLISNVLWVCVFNMSSNTSMLLM